MFITVSNYHSIFVETYGNPSGIKVLFLHGGPGIGCSDNDKRFFDPKKFFVVFIDQRGCGKSTPKGELRQNTTKALLDDITIVLDRLHLKEVIIFGGSWGATLATLYAAENPTRVTKLILRGFFPATKECTNLYLEGGVRTTHPSQWKRVSEFAKGIPDKRIAQYYFDKICGSNESNALCHAYEWSRFGFSLSRKSISEKEIDAIMSIEIIDKNDSKIELHYALNNFFIPEGYLYKLNNKLGNIPIVVIQGNYDYICPVSYAKTFVSSLDNARIIEVNAGHAASEVAIEKELFKALDSL